MYHFFVNTLPAVFLISLLLHLPNPFPYLFSKQCVLALKRVLLLGNIANVNNGAKKALLTRCQMMFTGASFSCDNNKKQAQKCTRKHCNTPFRICKCALPRKTDPGLVKHRVRHDPTWSHLLTVKSTSTSLRAHLSKPENWTPRDPSFATCYKSSWMSEMQQRLNYSDKKRKYSPSRSYRCKWS